MSSNTQYGNFAAMGWTTPPSMSIKYQNRRQHKPLSAPTTPTTTTPSPSSRHLHTSAWHEYNARPEHIDEFVALEMQQLRNRYAHEEERYVAQMLVEQPVEDVRRVMPARAASVSVATTTQSNSIFYASSTSSSSCSSPVNTPAESQLQRQRAESCRKSRYNNKIKKAKLRFRHKFVTKQMLERSNVLDYIHNVIAETETQLLARGYSRTMLEQLRQSFGVERSVPSTINITPPLSD